MTPSPLRPLLALLLALLGAPLAARAQVEVNIDQGQRQALPIAAPPFSGGDARASALGAQIATVMAADLERSGFFRPLPQSAFPETGLDVAATPNLPAWRTAGAQALVNGHAQIDGDGRLRVDFRLWDTASGAALAGVQFTSTAENWRRLAHKVADNVYKRLTGEDGYFDTRVVFVAESGPKTRRTKRLAVMDQDGANPSFLTTGAEQVLSPRYSQAGQEIAYLALRADSSRLYLFNLETARHESLGDFGGAAYAPGFSPDGEKLAFTLSKGANADIYVMDLRSRATRQLTTTPAIDTSPAFSPDGGKIVFNSDRGGSPQLYVMDVSGAGQRRISFGKGRYTAPVWSPKGDLIAFVRQEGGQFHIGVMKPDGSEERTLTSGYLDEAPTFAPNGRVIMFSHETSGGAPRLWTVDVTGRVQKPVPYAGGAATDPAWSPLLK